MHPSIARDARMPFPDSPFWLTTDDAVATLWLDCGTLTPASVRQLADLAGEAAARPAVEVLVLRSARPGGFPSSDPATLADLTTDDRAAAYTVAGQNALRAVADVPVPSVAFLEGACVGAGFELALACDYRLAVATPDAVLGFGPHQPAWGGGGRLARRIGRRAAGRFTACYPRPAVALGLADDAFSPRRAKIELRSFLDRLLFRPVKRGAASDPTADAAERRRFRAAARAGAFQRPSPVAGTPLNPVPSHPRRVGVIGAGPELLRWAGEFALRGIPTLWLPPSRPARPADRRALFAAALRGGRVTPLEADQAAARVEVVAVPDDALTADLVVLDGSDDTGTAFLERVMRPRAVLLVPAADLGWLLPSCDRPGRVLGWTPGGTGTTLTTHPAATDDAIATARTWLSAVGVVADLTTTTAPTPARPSSPLSAAPALAGRLR